MFRHDNMAVFRRQEHVRIQEVLFVFALFLLVCCAPVFGEAQEVERVTLSSTTGILKIGPCKAQMKDKIIDLTPIEKM